VSAVRLSEVDRRAIIERYSQRFAKYGHSPKALGWDKGKQDIRFHVLLSAFDLRGRSVLDIGCGFGDAVPLIRERSGDDFTYHGIDVVDDLLAVARELHAAPNVTFETADFLAADLPDTYDVVIASGIFNHVLTDMDGDAFSETVLQRAYAVCTEGVAFDFLSDKVDFRTEHNHYSSPERVLALAYSHSRNVVLRNDYMPFEFSLFVFKDDGFDSSDTLFRRYKDGRVRLEA
jgi:SAM-dependent methyltransferase